MKRSILAFAAFLAFAAAFFLPPLAAAASQEAAQASAAHEGDATPSEAVAASEEAPAASEVAPAALRLIEFKTITTILVPDAIEVDGSVSCSLAEGVLSCTARRE